MIERADEDKVSQLQDKVDEIEDNTDLDDPQIEMTDAARRRAGDVEKLITASQLANFISARSDEVVSPSEALIDTMDDARAGSDEDYNDVRDDAVKQVI